MTGETQIRVQLCQQEIVLRRMRFMAANALTLAYWRMNVSLVEFLCFVLMTLEAQRFVTFY
jgi:hypothetical protein